MDGSPVPDPMLTDAATCTDAVAVRLSFSNACARLEAGFAVGCVRLGGCMGWMG